MKFERIEIGDSGVTGAKIIPGDKSVDQAVEFFEFDMSAYTNLRRGPASSSNWDTLFLPVNGFIQTLPPDLQGELLKLYVQSHRSLIEYIEHAKDKAPNKLMREIGDKWTELFRNTDMWDRLIDYIRQGNITLAEDDFKLAGTRPQDSESMTFKLEQGIEVAGMALVSKIMSPIFAVAMRYFTRMDEVSTETKVVYISAMISPTMTEICGATFMKLQSYIETYVWKYLKTDVRKALAGMTPTSVSQLLIAKIMVQAFVNLDMLNNPKNNPLTYVRSTVLRAIKHMKGATTYTIRKENPWEDEDGESPDVLEINSAVSKTTLMIPMTVKCMCHKVVDVMCRHYEISEEDQKSCVDYYRGSPFCPDSMSLSLVYGLFGRKFGGSSNIEHLEFIQFVSLAAVVQILCFKAGYHTLGHIVTATEDILKREPDRMETLIVNNGARCPEYHSCMDHYSLLSQNKWEETVFNLLRKTAQTKHIFNTAPIIWNTLEQRSRNGSVIPLDSSIGMQFSAFVENYIHGTTAEWGEEML